MILCSALCSHRGTELQRYYTYRPTKWYLERICVYSMPLPKSSMSPQRYSDTRASRIACSSCSSRTDTLRSGPSDSLIRFTWCALTEPKPSSCIIAVVISSSNWNSQNSSCTRDAIALLSRRTCVWICHCWSHISRFSS